MNELAAVAATFGTITVVELPDKTFVATLVLSTRYRPLAVWLGVGVAFGIQTLIAVVAGRVVAELPTTPVQVAAATMFLLGAVLLLRSARSADEAEQEQEAEYEERAGGRRGFLGAAWLSLIVILAAEWGDLSQLLTVSLVQRFDAAPVFVGAWAALLTVSGFAALGGGVLLRHLRLGTVHFAGAAVCLVLAALTVYEILAG
ncbi:MAG: TMEM165/GDT1 family protein [Nocardioidaceae bacterium]|nr:TMEM165/GDT1 family protein [Nocardioidaceae bacterium]